MTLTVDERLTLLRTLSYAHSSSHASIDTIGDSGLVAFLQVQDTLRDIGSRPASVSTIDVLMPMLVSLCFDNAALPLLKLGGRAILSRVANSRVVVGKFVSELPDVQASTTARLYGGVQKRFTFATYQDVLAAHRLEQAVVRHGDQGIGGLLASVAPGEVDRVLKSRPAGTRTPPGASARVAVVDAALSYAVHQHFVTDLVFNELKDLVRLDASRELADFESLVQDLTAIYVPFKVGGVDVALDQLRNTFGLFFEELSWAMVFFGNDGFGLLKTAGTKSAARIVYFDDVDKDVALTRYLLKRFARAKASYSETSSRDFQIDSQRNLMVDRFRELAKKLSARKSEFAGQGSILDVM